MRLVKLSATYASYIDFLGMYRMLMFTGGVLVRRDIIRSSSTFSSNLDKHELRTVVADSL